MTTFDSTKTELGKLLSDICEGKIQLPDFQRGWVWDDEHIRSLLVSITRSFPIGAIMLLETGGNAKFQMRPIEGISLAEEQQAEKVILDGQQRLTSLAQVLKNPAAVVTRDEKKKTIKRYYYFDIEKALEGPTGLEEAVIGVDEDRIRWTNFGRDITLDLSSPEKEYAEFYFPCSQILNSDCWEEGLMASAPERFPRYMEFRKQVLTAFRSYLVPVIEMKKETSKEAVCLVFEKVNTGGVPLSVFELVTATYAAEGFNLRRDWYGEREEKGRQALLLDKALLKGAEPTDFLQGICLLYTYHRQQSDLSAGKTGKSVTAVSAKREHILTMPLAAYKQWATPLVQGFLEAERFLRHIGFYNPKYLPYRIQLIPLATLFVLIGDRWLEPQIQDKIARWYWCGVFGELYGSASETRIALDFLQLLQWIDDNTSLPKTITDAGFQSSRLESMRTRTSAAYRGLYTLLQHFGAKDFYWKAGIVDIDRDEKGIDIHHIFPKAWCDERKIPSKVYDSIINKTPISYKANRKIGGKAPSVYLEQIQKDPAVLIDDAIMDAILRTHDIDPALLRKNDFEAFFNSRKTALLQRIETAMGKQVIQMADSDDEYSEEISFSDL